jgi:branched-chain amino acid transport system permease protein
MTDSLASIGLNETNFQFMCIAAILGVSIYMTLYGGMFSLANAGFMAIGAYVSVILTQTHEWSFLPAVLMGMVAAACIAVPVGLTVLRLNDIYLAIATIGFGEVVRITILNFDRIYREITDEKLEITGGATGIKGIPVLTETHQLVIVLILLAYFLFRMQNSRFGRALTAIRQDEKVAANLGINVVYYKNVAFILGAAVAGLGGALSGHLTRIITPSAYGFGEAVNILTYAVMGGTISIFGPIFGGMLLVYLPELLRRADVFDSLSDLTGLNLVQSEAQILGALNGVILLLVIIYLPGGVTDPRIWGRVFRPFQGITARFSERAFRQRNDDDA